jgi:hypothetical protein
MKTSYKLLLAFFGLLVLLMLIADGVIWANYKRGYTGKGPIKTEVNTPQLGVKLPAFKVLKINGVPGHNLSIIKGDTGRIILSDGHQDAFLYTAQHDTVILNLEGRNVSALECAGVEAIILSSGGLVLSDFDGASLDIQSAESCFIELVNVRIGKLRVNGGAQNELRLNGSTSKIDSLQVALGKNSVMMSFDVSYGKVAVDVDSLRELQMTGASLSAMKQIR